MFWSLFTIIISFLILLLYISYTAATTFLECSMSTYIQVALLVVLSLPSTLLSTWRTPAYLLRPGLGIHHFKKPFPVLQGRTGICVLLCPMHTRVISATFSIPYPCTFLALRVLEHRCCTYSHLYFHSLPI